MNHEGVGSNSPVNATRFATTPQERIAILRKAAGIMRQRREELKDDGRVEGPGAPPPYPAAANAIARRKQVDELMTRYRRGGWYEGR